MSFWTDLTGGPKTVTTDTTVANTKTTNWPMIIGGIVVGVGAIVGIAWALGAFDKKKTEPKAA